MNFNKEKENKDLIEKINKILNEKEEQKNINKKKF